MSMINPYGNPNTAYVPGKRYAPVTSFSGADMMVQFVFPSSSPIEIGTASTVSYSSFRQVRQVRTLGRISPKAVTRGPRTIGGTLVFTIINQHVTNDIMDALKTSPYYTSYGKMKPDELPPFDIVITFANEYGQTARLVIYGVTIVDDGNVLSVEDDYTETTISFVARDIDVMKGPYDPKMGMYTERGQDFRSANEPVAKFKVVSTNAGSALQSYWDTLTGLKKYAASLPDWVTDPTESVSAPTNKTQTVNGYTRTQ